MSAVSAPPPFAAASVAVSAPKQTPLEWISGLLDKAPNFDIWAERPRMAKRIFPECLDRDGPLKALFGSMQNQFEILLTADPRTPLNTVVAAPGAGKTFLLGSLLEFARQQCLTSRISPHSAFPGFSQFSFRIYSFLYFLFHIES